MTFTANDVEAAAGEAWMAQHQCQKRAENKAANEFASIGVSCFSWVFTQTSVAMAVHVRCKCGAEENVSDVDSW